MVFKKKKARQRMKGFVQYDVYYPEADLFSVSGEYVKAWYLCDMEASDKKEYEKYLDSCIFIPDGGCTQVCHIAGKDVLIIRIPAESAEDALAKFSAMKVIGSQVSCAEWFDLISRISVFDVFAKPELIGAVKKKGKPAASIINMIQPFKAETVKSPKGKQIKTNTAKFLAINDGYVKTLALTNYPAYIHPSLITEILRLSDDIVTALFIRRVDKEKCIKVFDKFPVQMSRLRMERMKEELHDEEALYYVSCYIAARADTKDALLSLIEKIYDTAEKYLVGINTLEYEQLQAYRAMIPLGSNFLKCSKVLHKSDLPGLLPLSWVRHVSTDITYGCDTATGMEITYNRVKAKASGFVLGSDPGRTAARIIREIEQITEHVPDKRIAVFTFDADTLNWTAKTMVQPLVTGDSTADREALKALTVLACGNNRDLSKEKKQALDETLNENPGSFEDFVSMLSDRVPGMGKELAPLQDAYKATVESESAMTIYQIGDKNTRYSERAAMLVQALFHTKADIVYVVCAEALSVCDAVPFLLKNRPDVLWTFASVNRTDGLRQMYLNRSIARTIENADFLDISTHTVTDRIRLKSILQFGKKETAVLSAQDGDRGLLVMDNTTYIYEEKGAGCDE